jgi:hypothetical protein
MSRFYGNDMVFPTPRVRCPNCDDASCPECQPHYKVFRAPAEDGWTHVDAPVPTRDEDAA